MMRLLVIYIIFVLYTVIIVSVGGLILKIIYFIYKTVMKSLSIETLDSRDVFGVNTSESDIFKIPAKTSHVRVVGQHGKFTIEEEEHTHLNFSVNSPFVCVNFLNP